LWGENLENTKYGFNSYLKKLLLISKNYTDNICFIWPTNVDENIVWPNYNGRWYKNNRIKEFDEIIEKFCLENALKYINLFGLLDNKDFYDWLHPNEFWHKKIFTKVKWMIL
jgi:hypothetical protein